MKRWNRILQTVIALAAVVGLGCAPPTTTTEAPAPPSAEGESTAAEGPQSDGFDQAEGSLFEVNAPHKIEEGILHLQASQESTILLAAVNNLSATEYTVSVEVMPPGVGEHVGLAFVQSGNTNGLFYLYQAPNASRFSKKCSVALEVINRGRKIRDPDIRVREIDFQLNTPIKLSVRHVGPTVFLLINNENIGRFREQYLKPAKVGVYGKSLHADSSDATVRFDNFTVE